MQLPPGDPLLKAMAGADMPRASLKRARSSRQPTPQPQFLSPVFTDLRGSGERSDSSSSEDDEQEVGGSRPSLTTPHQPLDRRNSVGSWPRAALPTLTGLATKRPHHNGISGAKPDITVRGTVTASQIPKMLDQMVKAAFGAPFSLQFKQD
jgi:hypothetical protein